MKEVLTDKYTVKQLEELADTERYKIYEWLNNYILDHYNVNQIWGKSGKYGKICLRYSRNGKTLCTIYFRQKQLGIWIVLGKEVRNKFEKIADKFSVKVQDKYESTEAYHDGKWLMFDVDNTELFSDIRMLLEIKKWPNRKLTMCGSYPCETFMDRKGLSYDEAYEIKELDILSYYEYLGAFDNKSRLDRKLK